jgi:hypothetical protein
MGRPLSQNPMVHTAVVLPADLISKLRADAEAEGRGLSAEIRQRLGATYQLLRGDPETGNLLNAIKHLAYFLARDLGKEWHQHPYAMAAFKAGVADLLSRYQPEGDERVRPETQVVGDPPDVVGRTHARRIRIAGHETEDDYDPTDYDDETELDLRSKRVPINRKKQ